MAKKARFPVLLAGAAILAAAELAVLAVALSVPAQAQFFEPRRQQRGPGFFQQLFGPSQGGGPAGPGMFDQPAPQQVEASRPPPAPKSDTPPSTAIMVMGDSMAEWLAYGLEETFADIPEIGVLRKDRGRSGLVRYDARGEQEWPAAARDLLAQEKADYVVIMLGMNDRQAFRERDLKNQKQAADKKQEAEKKEAEKKPEGDNKQEKADAEQDDDDLTIAAPEPDGKATGRAEFRSERWVEIYTKRIDDLLAAARSKGLPVFWVGLPPIRGARSTSDAVYLNDLYRARAEKTGAVYIDVWDGFVDEAGKFTTFGPDFEGQTRRLRSGDGAHFTRYGARKLAHYVERELRRVMSTRATPVALPSGGLLAPQSPNARPEAGPVLPLTVTSGGTEELLGGGGARPAPSDVVADQVLVKGAPLAAARGRADDFAWPRGEARPAEVVPVAIPAAEPEPASKPGQKKTAPAAKPKATQQTSEAQPRTPQRAGPPQQQQAPRPQQPLARAPSNPFGWFR